jgi:hypothetical protein
MEFFVVCPKCKAMETLDLLDGHLVINRKFVEKEGGIFHLCGSYFPCRIFSHNVVLDISLKQNTRPEN